MKNELQIFKNDKFGEIEILIENGKEYFPATEIAKILGYSNPHDAIIRHCKKEGLVIHEGVLNAGLGEQKVSKKYIDEGNLYRLIIKSNLPQAEVFERWVFDDVLPTIRKKGMYATDELLDNPDLLIATATRLKEEREKRKQLEEKIEKDRSKVVFAEALEISNRSILIGELAKLLNQNGINVGQNRLFAWLRDNGYLCARGEQYNLPTQKSLDLKIMEIKKRVINQPVGVNKTTSTTKITVKGQEYFINKFLKDISA